MPTSNFFTLIKRFRSHILAKWFYTFTRFIMAIGFILSGLRKLPGVHFALGFTHLPDGQPLPPSVDNPIGAFFFGMESTGFYWNFIGCLQILLGILLFFYRFSVVVPVLMMPITLNIFLISASLGMKGTPLITFLMAMANAFMILWHHEHFLPLLKRPRRW